MRLIDADALIMNLDDRYSLRDISREDRDTVVYELNDAPTIEPQTTTWLGSYSPYTCQHCGKHTDSKTPFCAWCGRRASNYD